jgi:hypothetical protein
MVLARMCYGAYRCTAAVIVSLQQHRGALHSAALSLLGRLDWAPWHAGGGPLTGLPGQTLPAVAAVSLATA